MDLTLLVMLIVLGSFGHGAKTDMVLLVMAPISTKAVLYRLEVQPTGLMLILITLLLRLKKMAHFGHGEETHLVPLDKTIQLIEVCQYRLELELIGPMRYPLGLISPMEQCLPFRLMEPCGHVVKTQLVNWDLAI
jgi:hypothetical protein